MVHKLTVNVIYRPPSTKKVNSVRNSRFIEAAALSPHENIIWRDIYIHIDSQNRWDDNFTPILSYFDLIQHVPISKHIQGQIVDVLCTGKSFSPAVCHYLNDGISDHLTVFFSIAFPVRNSCSVKCVKVLASKLGKINKCEFVSDIAKYELIQATCKTHG